MVFGNCFCLFCFFELEQSRFRVGKKHVLKFLFFFFVFIPLSLIRLVSWGAAAPTHLEATTHTPGHTSWGFASGSTGVTTIASIATASVPLIITTTITSPASIATSISTISTSPLTSGATPLATMTTSPLVTSTASHHVSHVGVHTAGVLGFGSHFFHFQFSAADVNCALFQELFGYVFTLVGDETKVFAFILDLVEGLFNVSDGTESSHVVFNFIITKFGGQFSNVNFALFGLGLFDCNFLV